MKALRATKIYQYLIEPQTNGHSRSWEGHHATNPTSIRLRDDPRVFLGYRAGGDDDYYRHGPHDVWMSSLGMAILDERGERVIHRFALPIMRLLHDVEPPKTQEAFDRLLRLHPDRFFSLHDFRFVEYGENLYVLHHRGSASTSIDCVVRMPTADFLSRIGESIKLQGRPVEEILSNWHATWWQDGVWEPCGVNGGLEVWPSRVNKGDIVFFERPDGSLQLCHRPFPDIAVLDSGRALHAPATPDGIAVWGVLEQCVRPGCTDNSHIGSNGSPTRARIGDVDVYIDVTHGCHNEAISNPEHDAMWVSYYPYLRIKDYETAEQLYYSEEPILDYDEVWRDYAEEGAWVSRNPVLRGVMFAGGQVEAVRGRNGLDDAFSAYIGLGDTAVGRAVFRLRDLIPDAVIADILVRKRHQSIRVGSASYPEYAFPEEISGWHWMLRNDPDRRVVLITRVLAKNGYRESAVAPINTRPGYFDADGVWFDGESIRFDPDLGWIALYRGFRWDETNGRKATRVGYGVVVLDADNPQRVLYRSRESIAPVVEESGWTAGDGVDAGAAAYDPRAHVPERTAFEIARTRALYDSCLTWRPHMQAWLVEKSAFWDRHTYEDGQVSRLEGEVVDAPVS